MERVWDGFEAGLGLARDEHPTRSVGRRGRGDELLEVALEATLEHARRIDRLGIEDDEGMPQV